MAPNTTICVSHSLIFPHATHINVPSSSIFPFISLPSVPIISRRATPTRWTIASVWGRSAPRAALLRTFIRGFYASNCSFSIVSNFAGLLCSTDIRYEIDWTYHIIWGKSNNLILLIKSRIISALIIIIICTIWRTIKSLTELLFRLFLGTTIPTQVYPLPILRPCKQALGRKHTSTQMMELCLESVDPYLHIHRAEDFYLERNLDSTATNAHRIVVINFKANQTKRRCERGYREG